MLTTTATGRFIRLLMLSSCLVVILAAGAVPAVAGARHEQPAAGGAAAPLAPSYLDSLTSLPAGILAIGDGGHGLGLRPAPQRPVAVSAGGKSARALEAALPSAYDLRTAGRVSSVKDQGAYGTCWSFAACGSLESALLPGESSDFAEDNMVLTSGFYGGGDAYNWGGNIWMAAAYLTRWGGPVFESDDAYGDGFTPIGLTPRKHVQDIMLVPARTGPLDNDAIKNAVTQYGGAYVSMCWSSSSTYYKPATAAYYYDGTAGTNHGVLIVGWNDAFPASSFATTPSGPGAFLVKNSWGSGWGSGGYFWASYYDSKFGRAGEMAVFNGSESPSNYSGVYQYDPLGDCNDYGYGGSTGWFANVFTAQSSASLRAVGFYALAPNSTYEVYTGTSLAAKTLATSGTLSMGYHTVALPSPVSLTAGQTFVVAVKLTTPGYTYPIAFEAPYSNYSPSATAAAGQSYVSSSGSSWTDFTTQVAKGNVCLKAFVSGSSTSTGPTISGFSPVSGPVGAAVTVTGTGFGTGGQVAKSNVTRVAFNGVSASYSVTSPTQLTATVPTGATTGRITVTTAAGTGTSASNFTVTTPSGSAPTVGGFSPLSGLVGSSVTVTGTGFSGVSRVAFNGVAAVFNVTSATQITATVPSGATTGRISVTTSAGTGTSASSFTVTTPSGPAPTVGGFSPLSGLVGSSVTVTGSGFSGVSRVAFNGVSASYSVTSPTQLTATVPTGATTGRITVTTAAGTGTSASNFTVTTPSGSAPTVGGFSPLSGLVGSSVTITGTGFSGVSRVAFNGVAAVFNVTSATQLTATVPSGATTGRISVTTSAGTGTSASSFTVTTPSGPAPTISGFTPATAPVRTIVTITGTGFSGVTQVSFNGVNGQFMVDNSTTIRAVVPAGATSGPVRVVTSGGTAVSACAVRREVTRVRPDLRRKVLSQAGFAGGSGRGRRRCEARPPVPRTASGGGTGRARGRDGRCGAKVMRRATFLWMEHGSQT